MTLKDFVKDTLEQITQGVKEAQDTCKEWGGLINPMLEIPVSNAEKFQVDGKYYPASKVNYTVVLADTENTSKKGGVGVLLPRITLGGQVESEKEYKVNTTLDFSVTVVLPYIDRNGKHIPLSMLNLT